MRIKIIRKFHLYNHLFYEVKSNDPNLKNKRLYLDVRYGVYFDESDFSDFIVTGWLPWWNCLGEESNQLYS